MFTINDDLSIYATRGDTVFFTVTAEENGLPYTFQAGDVLRIKVFEKKNADNVVLEKDFGVTAATDKFTILLTEDDTKIGEVISKAKDYWYEIELNPFTNPQTIIGFDEDGAKIFKLFPEGADSEEPEVKPEDIPVVDDELDMTSTRPVQNQAISRAIVNLEAAYKVTKKEVEAKAQETSKTVANMGSELATERARIDNLVSSPTPGDSELVDIRVGADGETYVSAGTAVRNQITSIIDKLKAAKVDYDETLEEIHGFYITNEGVVTENESYSISEPIHIPSGYTLTFTARGYKTSVAMIAKLHEDGTYSSLVDSVDSENNAYTFKTTEAVDVVFSWSTSRGYSLHINTDIFDLISVLSDRMEALAEDTKNASLEADYVSLSLFSKFGVVGDSYASGEVYFDEKFHDIYEISWGQILARKLGTSCVNFSGGGYSTRGWLNNSKGLALMLNTEAQDVYYLCLGINDANYYGAEYLGTVADIKEDYTQNPDTFFGNYGKIIRSIMEHAPNAKIVMSTIVPTTNMKATYNSAIIEIANHFSIPYIVQTDDTFFTSDMYVNGMVQGHPVAVVYSGMANAIERLLKKCIIKNFAYFKDTYMH